MQLGTFFEFRQDQIIEELDIEHLKKMKKLQNNPKYKFIMSQMTDEKLVNKVFEVMPREA